MSQITKPLTASGPIPPDIATEYDTQNGNAIPLANILIVDGFDSTVNNTNGIATRGGVVGTGTQNEVDVILTNRFHGSVTTTDATPTTLATCPMATNPAVFVFVVNLAVIDLTDNLGSGLVATVSLRTTGGAPVILGLQDFIIQDDVAFLGSATLIGSSTTFTVQVTGVAGKTMNWVCTGTYTVAS